MLFVCRVGLCLLCSKCFLFFSAAIPLTFAYFAHYLLSITRRHNPCNIANTNTSLGTYNHSRTFIKLELVASLLDSQLRPTLEVYLALLDVLISAIFPPKNTCG